MNNEDKEENVLIDKDNWKLIKNDGEADYSYCLQNKNTEDTPAKANSPMGIKIYLNKSTDNNDLKEFEKELDKIIVAEKLKEEYDYIENVTFKPISSNNILCSKLELKDDLFNRFKYNIDFLTAQNGKTLIVQINNVTDLKDESLNKIVEQYENSLEKDTSSSESQKTLQDQNEDTTKPKVKKQR